MHVAGRTAAWRGRSAVGLSAAVCQRVEPPCPHHRRRRQDTLWRVCALQQASRPHSSLQCQCTGSRSPLRVRLVTHCLRPAATGLSRQEFRAAPDSLSLSFSSEPRQTHLGRPTGRPSPCGAQQGEAGADACGRLRAAPGPGLGPGGAESADSWGSGWTETRVAAAGRRLLLRSPYTDST